MILQTIKKRTYLPILGIGMLCTVACTKAKKSVDFTQPELFTAGIEGPATDYLGNVYAVNYEKEGTIGRITKEGESSLFVQLPNGSIGNGIRFGKEKQMFVADYTNHNILEIDIEKKSITVFAHESKANQPNDLAIAPNKILYASDPNWSDNTGNLWKVTKEKGFELLEGNMGTTNGVEVSPDGTKLYVNESVQRKIWVYDIVENGGVANKSELLSFPDFGLDGMRCDPEGNLYVCRFGKGTVVKVAPSGAILEEISVQGKNPTNLTFSPDYTTLYVTVADRGCLEKIIL